MTAPIVIRVLGPFLLALSSMALQAAPGDKTMRVYSTRMETLFIRLDVNGDGRLDASEVQGRRALSRVLKRQNNRSYLLLKDLRLQDSSPSGPRLKRHFRKADLDQNHRLIVRKPSAFPGSVAISIALDGDDGMRSVTLEDLWNHQRPLPGLRQRLP